MMEVASSSGVTGQVWTIQNGEIINQNKVIDLNQSQTDRLHCSA